jgi:hypothetical protein
VVGQFEFIEWTPDGHLHHSRYMDLRTDIEPQHAVREDGDVASAMRTSHPEYAIRMALKVSKWVMLVAILIQVIPYGRTHTNPSNTGDLRGIRRPLRHFSAAPALTAIVTKPCGLGIPTSRRYPGSSSEM